MRLCGAPVREGIVCGGGANNVWGGAYAVLCQCLHDAVDGHGMAMVGDTYRGGEQRSCECCANVRGFGAPSRHQSDRVDFNYIIIYVDFAFAE